MLSKLFYPPSNRVNTATVKKALRQYLDGQYPQAEICDSSPGGTLGAFFTINIDGTKRFVKTHLYDCQQSRDNLKKETLILKKLYDESLNIQSVELTIGDKEQIFLVMNMLESVGQMPDIGTVKNLVAEYREVLNSPELKEELQTLPGMYQYRDMYDEGQKALKTLAENQMISEKVAAKCQMLVDSIRPSDAETAISHGDLSNKNILKNKNRLFVLDWEDAICDTPKDFDMYCWLTFLDQRRYYGNRDFIAAKVGDMNICVAHMILVVILKCFISYENKSYLKYSFTFEQRLGEILKLMGE
jgi:thiamine kinase-like enzyme